MTYHNVFNLKKMTYIIVLKVTQFGEDQLIVFEIFSKNLHGEPFEPPLPPPLPVKIGQAQYVSILYKNTWLYAPIGTVGVKGCSFSSFISILDRTEHGKILPCCQNHYHFQGRKSGLFVRNCIASNSDHTVGFNKSNSL